MTVGEAAAKRYPGVTYDCALPQAWVNQCLEAGFDPRGHFVWGYPEGGSLLGEPLPITPEGEVRKSNHGK
jgi:hypothetical protein